jgi:hypothetical protein
MQSTGQLALQVPQAIHVSRIFLGMMIPPNRYPLFIHILHYEWIFVNKKYRIIIPLLSNILYRRIILVAYEVTNNLS